MNHSLEKVVLDLGMDACEVTLGCRGVSVHAVSSLDFDSLGTAELRRICALGIVTVPNKP